jgi:hypothetical protein
MLIDNFKFKPVTLIKYIMWLLLPSSLLSCRPTLIAIEDISTKKIDKTVYLSGNVVHVAPLVDRAAYQIEDATGSIWVVTPQEPPEPGQQIDIKGKIQHQSLSFAEGQLGDFYVVELEQLDDLEE